MNWKKRPHYDEWQLSLAEDIAASIHHYVRCGERWYLTCRKLGLETRSLDTEDIEEAKKSANAALWGKLVSEDFLILQMKETVRKLIDKAGDLGDHPREAHPESPA